MQTMGERDAIRDTLRKQAATRGQPLPRTA